MMEPFLAYWVHDLDPIIFSIGPLAIRWYGLAYIMGGVFAYVQLKYYHRKGRSALGGEDLENLMTAVFLGILLGGRLGYMLLYGWSDFISNPLILFKVWEGGMSFHGGLIGCFMGVYWSAKKSGTDLWQLADLSVTVGPIGLFFGRIANFINGELWGHPTSAPIGILFPRAPVVDDPSLIYVKSWGMYANPRHPSQLYEALGEGLLIFIYLQCRFWLSGKSLKRGQLSAEFLILYAIARIISEVFREPDASLILGMSRGTFYSLFMLLAGILLWTYSTFRKGDQRDISL